MAYFIVLELLFTLVVLWIELLLYIVHTQCTLWRVKRITLIHVKCVLPKFELCPHLAKLSTNALMLHFASPLVAITTPEPESTLMRDTQTTAEHTLSHSSRNQDELPPAQVIDPICMIYFMSFSPPSPSTSDAPPAAGSLLVPLPPMCTSGVVQPTTLTAGSPSPLTYVHCSPPTRPSLSVDSLLFPPPPTCTSSVVQPTPPSAGSPPPCKETAVHAGHCVGWTCTKTY